MKDTKRKIIRDWLYMVEIAKCAMNVSNDVEPQLLLIPRKEMEKILEIGGEIVDKFKQHRLNNLQALGATMVVLSFILDRVCDRDDRYSKMELIGMMMATICRITLMYNSIALNSPFIKPEQIRRVMEEWKKMYV